MESQLKTADLTMRAAQCGTERRCFQLHLQAQTLSTQSSARPPTLSTCAGRPAARLVCSPPDPIMIHPFSCSSFPTTFRPPLSSSSSWLLARACLLTCSSSSASQAGQLRRSPPAQRGSRLAPIWEARSESRRPSAGCVAVSVPFLAV